MHQSGAASFDPGFIDFVNSELNEADRPYDMSKMTEISTSAASASNTTGPGG